MAEVSTVKRNCTRFSHLLQRELSESGQDMAGGGSGGATWWPLRAVPNLPKRLVCRKLGGRGSRRAANGSGSPGGSPSLYGPRCHASPRRAQGGSLRRCRQRLEHDAEAEVVEVPPQYRP